MDSQKVEQVVWTTEQVKDRFKEAVSTAHQLPSAHVQGFFNSWPMIVRQPWEVMSSQDRPRLRPLLKAQLVERMDEAMGWLMWLDDPRDRRIVLGYAEDFYRSHIARKVGVSRSTIDRRYKSALQRIANQLNDQADGPCG